jgi:hypothetical protein
MPTPHSITWATTPATGDVRVEAGQRVVSPTPLLEVVALVLGTDRRSCVTNPDLGPDYTLVQKALPSAAATWRAAVLECLRFLVEGGWITELAVTVSQVADRLAYEVSFKDPNDPAAPPQTYRGEV